jgi:hypothetical protein
MDEDVETLLGTEENIAGTNAAREHHHLIVDTESADPLDDVQVEKPPSVFHIDRPETKVDRYPSNQLDEVNPFAFIKGKDDEDDASIGSEEGFGSKLLPQADGRGDFENVFEVREQKP